MVEKGESSDLGNNDKTCDLSESEKGDPSNLKIPCMIGRKFIANAYIDLDLPMNVMSLAYYNAIRNQGYEHKGNVEANIDPSLSQVVFGRPFRESTKLALDREKGLITLTDGIKKVTFKTPYRDSKMDDLTSEGHDLLSSRVILSDDDFRRGCERPSNLESEFCKDIDKLDSSDSWKIERLDIEGSFEAKGRRTSAGVTKALIGYVCKKISTERRNKISQCVETASGLNPDGVATVILDEKSPEALRIFTWMILG
ncbi:hypothetical protein Tco_1041215 [Tanacetum coccineum]|uniref:Uncharacterized protein n=1 Tax=Tanacetum coccineum TaxID=301880 RepID=A0ABQ5GH09_9ASTR